MKNKLIKAIFTTLVIGMMASCGSNDDGPLTPADLEKRGTPVTDKTKLRDPNFETKDFIDTGIGLVESVAFCTDGDTTNFMVKHNGKYEKITIRYNGIDTPESTGRIEPWGKQASKFNADKLNNAYRVVLDCERNIYDTVDGNGRYLGMVWYQSTKDSDFRNLNLELVELAYSKNYNYETESVYFKAFKEAGDYAERCGAKVYGERDPIFDYSEHIYEYVNGYGVQGIYDNYYDYQNENGETVPGIGETETHSGSKCHVKGVVIGMIGDSFVLRDLFKAEKTGLYATIYCFTAYGSSMASILKVGLVVEFYCTATQFNGNIQLSNINVKFSGKQKFVVENDYENDEFIPFTGPTKDYPELNLDPISIDNTTATKAILESKKNQYIETTITIRNIEQGDRDPDGNIISGTEYNSYFRKDVSKGHLTIYARLNNGLVFNLRVDGSTSPFPDETLFEVGKSYKVKGYMIPYFDNYQMMMFNNIASYNYITPIN